MQSQSGMAFRLPTSAFRVVVFSVSTCTFIAVRVPTCFNNIMKSDVHSDLRRTRISKQISVIRDHKREANRRRVASKYSTGKFVSGYDVRMCHRAYMQVEDAHKMCLSTERLFSAKGCLSKTPRLFHFVWVFSGLGRSDCGLEGQTHTEKGGVTLRYVGVESDDGT